VLIGLVAGVFSGLLGVGGGIIVVPMLVAFAGYQPKMAMATSLAAILFTSVAAAASHAQTGNVRWADAALIGLPAVVGATIGTEIHQRMRTRGLVLGFCVLLVGVAVRLAL
jgi:uncharacterized protein